MPKILLAPKQTAPRKKTGNARQLKEEVTVRTPKEGKEPVKRNTRRLSKVKDITEECGTPELEVADVNLYDTANLNASATELTQESVFLKQVPDNVFEPSDADEDSFSLSTVLGGLSFDMLGTSSGNDEFLSSLPTGTGLLLPPGDLREGFLTAATRGGDRWQPGKKALPGQKALQEKDDKKLKPEAAEGKPLPEAEVWRDTAVEEKADKKKKEKPLKAKGEKDEKKKKRKKKKVAVIPSDNESLTLGLENLELKSDRVGVTVQLTEAADVSAKPAKPSIGEELMSSLEAKFGSHVSQDQEKQYRPGSLEKLEMYFNVYGDSEATTSNGTDTLEESTEEEELTVAEEEKDGKQVQEKSPVSVKTMKTVTAMTEKEKEVQTQKAAEFEKQVEVFTAYLSQKKLPEDIKQRQTAAEVEEKVETMTKEEKKVVTVTAKEKEKTYDEAYDEMDIPCSQTSRQYPLFKDFLNAKATREQSEQETHDVTEELIEETEENSRKPSGKVSDEKSTAAGGESVTGQEEGQKKLIEETKENSSKPSGKVSDEKSTAAEGESVTEEDGQKKLIEEDSRKPSGKVSDEKSTEAVPDRADEEEMEAGEKSTAAAAEGESLSVTGQDAVPDSVDEEEMEASDVWHEAEGVAHSDTSDGTSDASGNPIHNLPCDTGHRSLRSSEKAEERAFKEKALRKDELEHSKMLQLKRIQNLPRNEEVNLREFMARDERNSENMGDCTTSLLVRPTLSSFLLKVELSEKLQVELSEKLQSVPKKKGKLKSVPKSVTPVRSSSAKAALSSVRKARAGSKARAGRSNITRKIKKRVRNKIDRGKKHRPVPFHEDGSDDDVPISDLKKTYSTVSDSDSDDELPLSALKTPGECITNFSEQVKVGTDVLTKYGSKWVPANIITIYLESEQCNGDCAVQYFSDPKSASDGYSLQSVSYDILSSDAKYILECNTVKRMHSSRRSIILFPRLTKYLSNCK
jgi:hypothetical protein